MRTGMIPRSRCRCDRQHREEASHAGSAPPVGSRLRLRGPPRRCPYNARMDATSAYNELIATTRDIALLRSVESVLGWDERVMMPDKGAEHRSNQMSLLARLTHDQFTSPRVGELIAQVEGTELVRDPESDAAVNVREIRRSYDRATKVPTKLVEELTKVGVLG